MTTVACTVVVVVLLFLLAGDIMSEISDFAARVDAAFTDISNAVEGVTLDIQALKDEIGKLQDSSGKISAEDQLTLDGIEARANAASEKLKALDDLTTPPEPTPE